jgi:hypothetical protein
MCFFLIGKSGSHCLTCPPPYACTQKVIHTHKFTQNFFPKIYPKIYPKSTTYPVNYKIVICTYIPIFRAFQENKPRLILEVENESRQPYFLLQASGSRFFGENSRHLVPGRAGQLWADPQQHARVPNVGPPQVGVEGVGDGLASRSEPASTDFSLDNK